jgi:hypothetical protein
MPPSTFVVITPNEFLLLGVHRDNGTSLLQEAANLAIQMLKLSVAIGMSRSFLQSFYVGLQAVSNFCQQSRHRIMADPITLLGQGISQFPCAFTCP